MKYDDATWHSGGDIPKDLADDAGATHIGMFVAWALLSGLSGGIHTVEFPEAIPLLRTRSVTPGAFFLASCDGKFTNEDLNDEGNAFTAAYFVPPEGGYLMDYEATFGNNLPTLYHVADTWEKYNRIAPILEERLRAWRRRS